jgi:hypothetical protein
MERRSVPLASVASIRPQEQEGYKVSSVISQENTNTWLFLTYTCCRKIGRPMTNQITAGSAAPNFRYSLVATTAARVGS